MWLTVKSLEGPHHWCWPPAKLPQGVLSSYVVRPQTAYATDADHWRCSNTFANAGPLPSLWRGSATSLPVGPESFSISAAGHMVSPPEMLCFHHRPPGQPWRFLFLDFCVPSFPVVLFPSLLLGPASTWVKLDIVLFSCVELVSASLCPFSLYQSYLAPLYFLSLNH